MKTLRLILITLGAVWLQVSFLGALRPFGIIPNLFLVTVLVAATILPRASDVMAMAVMGGFLLDTVSGSDFGLRTAFFCVLALAIVMLRRTGTEFGQIGMRLATVVSATALYNAIVLIPLLVSHPRVVWGTVGARVLLEMGGNVVLMLFMGWVLPRLFKFGSGGQPVIQPRRS